jgi:hypothetical protein
MAHQLKEHLRAMVGTLAHQVHQYLMRGAKSGAVPDLASLKKSRRTDSDIPNSTERKVFVMGKFIRYPMLCLAVFALSACDKATETAPVAEAPTQLQAPAATDNTAWRQYLMAVVKQNMAGIRTSPYMYYLPSTQDPEFAEKYQRQLENVEGVIARTVLPGNMLAFGSPESARMADMVITAFSQWAEPNAFQGVRVLFIGRSEDRQRVAEAVAPSGAEFVFVEAR